MHTPSSVNAPHRVRAAHAPRRAGRIVPGYLLLLALTALLLSACSANGETIRNVVEYQIRKAFPPVLVYRDPLPPGSLAGSVVDSTGQPIENAMALVSTVRGQVFQARSDAEGRYRIDGVTPGSYVPMAGAWGYDAVNGGPVQVRPGQALEGVDLTLPPHQTQPVEPANLRIGQPHLESSQFPTPMVATRIPFTFTLDGIDVDNGQIYLPAPASGEFPPIPSETGKRDEGSSTEFPSVPTVPTVPAPFDEGTAQPPTLVIIYPSNPLNWNAASVALTRDGNPVLAVGPHSSRGLDIDGHARNFRAVMQLWQDGELAPLGRPDDHWVAMSGSFGSLILFKALQDLPAPPPAVVNVGGISDAFLGIQALYDANLAIPAPYDSAVAALGRPDRDPAYFFGFSPVFYAGRLPPMFVIHTYNDEVIPYNQAEALDQALTAAGVPHELLLYRDTTHYLDAYNPTPATGMVYERVLEYVRSMLPPAP